LIIGFPAVELLFSNTTSLSILDGCIDVIYYADIILGFLTTYFNTTLGEEVFQPKAIAKHYLKGDFTLDFCSTFPFDWLLKIIGVKSTLVLVLAKLLKLLKIVRIFRLKAVIRDATLVITVKTYLKIVYVILEIVIVWHFIACLLWLVFSIDKVWWPPTDFSYYGMRDTPAFTDIHKRDSWFN